MNGIEGQIWKGPGGGSTALWLEKTYAELAAEIAASELIEGTVYYITDKSVAVTATSSNTVSLEGYYNTNSFDEWDYVEYDFPNDHIQRRVDKRGNDVGATFLYIDLGLIPSDPILSFRWSDDSCIGNYVNNAVFECSGTGNVYGNSVKEGSVVNINGSDGAFFNNEISGGSTLSSTGSTGDVSSFVVNNGSDVEIDGCEAELYAFFISGSVFTCQNKKLDSSYLTVISSNMTVMDGAVGCNLTNSSVTGGSIVSVSDDVTFVQVKCDASTITTSVTANLTRLDIKQNSLLNIAGTGNITEGSVSGGSTVTLNDASSAVRCVVEKGSTLTVSNNGVADLCKLNGTLTVSENANATGVYVYTGANVTCSGTSFIEGLIVRNVSVVNISDSVICSPGEIENQSTVTLSGTGNYGNCMFRGVTLVGTGDAKAQNCTIKQGNIELSAGCDIKNSEILLNGQTTPVLAMDSIQQLFITNETSNKAGTFALSAGTIDFDATDENHYTGNITVSIGSATGTLSGIDNMAGNATRYFKIMASAGETLTVSPTLVASLAADGQIIGTGNVVLVGDNGDFVMFEQKTVGGFLVAAVVESKVYL